MPILGTVGSEASRNKLKELSRGLGMNETFFFFAILFPQVSERGMREF